VTREGELLLNHITVTLDTLPTALRSMPGGLDRNIIVAVDSAAPSGIVVQAMLKAREGGAERFLFAVAPK
jgi:biopolymer transport protein ExbD